MSMMYDWASLDHCHCVWQVSRILVTGYLRVSLGPLCLQSLLVSGLSLLVSGMLAVKTLTSSIWPHTDLTQLSPNSIHLPTSQIRWQLSVCVNLRVIRTMKIFLSHNQHWDPITKFTTRIILFLFWACFYIFLVFPNYPLRCNKMKLTV